MLQQWDFQQIGEAKFYGRKCQLMMLRHEGQLHTLHCFYLYSSFGFTTREPMRAAQQFHSPKSRIYNA